MKRVLLLAVAFVLLGVSAARGDIPPFPPPEPKPAPTPQPDPAPAPTPEPNPNTGTVGCGAGLTASVVLAGLWLASRSRRRILQQS